MVHNLAYSAANKLAILIAATLEHFVIRLLESSCRAMHFTSGGTGWACL